MSSQKLMDLFEKLNNQFNLMLIQEEIEKKIIEFNFDEDKIIDWIIKNKNNENVFYKRLNKDDIEDIYNDYDEEFNISSMVEKEDFIKKIIELKGDRDALNDWIFETL